jgi:dUTP pyrophosphatase
MSSQSDTYLRFVKLSKDALSPTRERSRSAGFNLISPHNTIIPARGKSLILTDLQIQIPEGCYGRIAPTMSLALFHHISIAAGAIDNDSRGNIGVGLFNHSDNVYIVRRGYKIARLICENIYYHKLKMVQLLDEVSN